MKKIEVEIDLQGNISIEDDRGQSVKVVQELEKALGQVTSRKKTCGGPPQGDSRTRVQQGG
jgi:hypothetical protein